MHICSFRFPIRAYILFELTINVVVNNYNVVLISLNNNNLKLIEELLRDIITFHWYLILIETITILCAIVFINIESTSILKTLIEVWLVDFLIGLLFFETLISTSCMIFLYRGNVVNKFLENVNHDTITLVALPLYVAIVSLCFFALKLCTVITLHFYLKDIEIDVLHTSDDIESVTEQRSRTISFHEEIVSNLTSPPPYDPNWIQTGIPASSTSSPPPSYLDVVFTY